MAPIVRVEKSIFPKLLIILIFLIHFQRFAEQGEIARREIFPKLGQRWF
jgi:hypothetical protein